jgi:7-keto-8-aminopelargonate synthetase and related enzymes
VDSYALRLSNFREKGLYREWKSFSKLLLNFSSNDYLGLADDPRLKRAAIEAIDLYGTGSTSSRAVFGSLPLHDEIEESLAKFFYKESAVLFNTGFQANSTLLKTLASDETLYLLDHNCHRSLIEGAYNSKAVVKRFRHNDLNHLEELLTKYRSSYSTCWIVTESLFSMDGDFAPLQEMIELKDKFQSYLMVDDAHAIGVLGDHGEGLGVGADLVVGTFGKAFGSFGAFAASTSLIIDYLRQFCPGLIYTTALPPSILGSIKKALELMPDLNKERAHLKSLALSHIIPIVVEDPQHAVEKCFEAGIIVHAIRPPTVVQPILRISLTAHHTLQDLNRLESAIQTSCRG